MEGHAVTGVAEVVREEEQQEPVVAPTVIMEEPMVVPIVTTDAQEVAVVPSMRTVELEVAPLVLTEEPKPPVAPNVRTEGQEKVVEPMVAPDVRTDAQELVVAMRTEDLEVAPSFLSDGNAGSPGEHPSDPVEGEDHVMREEHAGDVLLDEGPAHTEGEDHGAAGERSCPDPVCAECGEDAEVKDPATGAETPEETYSPAEYSFSGQPWALTGAWAEYCNLPENFLKGCKW
ncbi:hypothetical protein GDO81_024792 [Engystomops pustulosus]|uniref:Uncharacterized protein n=1 Tax=Engystomops pustulosus TaxID=76066 RepID=A0AAV6YIA7_ENGPU|nr:hypothetical protein GDO81_024792 [Engystomops pustulosus]